MIVEFCGCSVGMAEVGCGLLRLVMGLVEIGVGHGEVMARSWRWILDSAWLDSSS